MSRRGPDAVASTAWRPWCWGDPLRKRDTPSPWGRRLLRSDCGCYSAPSAEASPSQLGRT